MSSPMDLDVTELHRATARIAAQHDAIVGQALAVDAVEAGAATSGHAYAPAGASYVGLMRGNVVQSLQGLAAEVRTVAGTLSATISQYIGTENRNARRLTS